MSALESGGGRKDRREFVESVRLFSFLSGFAGRSDRPVENLAWFKTPELRQDRIAAMGSFVVRAYQLTGANHRGPDSSVDRYRDWVQNALVSNR